MSNSHRLARTALQTLAVVAVSAAVYHVGRDGSGSTVAAAFVVGGLLLFLSLTRWIPQTLSLIYIAAVVVPCYAVEIYLQYDYHDLPARAAEAATRHGYTYDPRSVDEVTRDLLAAGTAARPFFRLLDHDASLVPLGTTPNRTIVYCNELGERMVYQADRHGFNNPDALWDESEMQALIVGDSFAHGACAPRNDGFAARIREVVPGTLNLSMSANSPQLNLATIAEYAGHVRPREILWFHYSGNDLEGLMSHRDHPVIRRYLDDRFTQRLYDRRDEVAALNEDFFRERLLPTVQSSAAPEGADVILDLRLLARLFFLRSSLGLTVRPPNTYDFELLHTVFERAQAESHAIDATLSIVSMPPGYALTDVESREDARVREIAQDLGIPFFDLRPVFSASSDASALYAFGSRRHSHLSDQGNALVADFVLKEVLSAGSKR